MIRDAIVLGPILESDTLQFFKFFVAGIDALGGRVEAEAQRPDRLQLRSQEDGNGQINLFCLSSCPSAINTIELAVKEII